MDCDLKLFPLIINKGKYPLIEIVNKEEVARAKLKGKPTKQTVMLIFVKREALVLISLFIIYSLNLLGRLMQDGSEKKATSLYQKVLTFRCKIR